MRCFGGWAPWAPWALWAPWAAHRAGAPLSGQTGGAAILKQWRPTSLSQADADGPRLMLMMGHAEKVHLAILHKGSPIKRNQIVRELPEQRFNPPPHPLFASLPKVMNSVHILMVFLLIGSSHSFLLHSKTKIQSSFYLFLPEIDSCRAVTAGERDFFIFRHGFLRGGIPIFLTVGLGGDREARQIHNGSTANPLNRDRNPEIGGQEEFARSKR